MVVVLITSVRHVVGDPCDPGIAGGRQRPRGSARNPQRQCIASNQLDTLISERYLVTGAEEKQLTQLGPAACDVHLKPGAYLARIHERGALYPYFPFPPPPSPSHPPSSPLAQNYRSMDLGLIKSGYWGTADFAKTGSKFKMTAAAILNIDFGS